MESKTFGMAVKAAGPADGLQEGQFTGYASVFGNKDSVGDVVLKGAFTETLSEWEAKGDPIPLLWGHDNADPFSNIGSVDAKEDAHGLHVTGTLDLDNPKAAQVYKLLKGRRVGQMSFAYEIVDSGWAELNGEDVLELKRLKLYEASVVPIGANQATEILAVKANAEGLAAGVKAGRVISEKNLASLRSARDAIDAVITAASAEEPEKASGAEQTQDEEPSQAKSEESPRVPSVSTWEIELSLIEMEGPHNV